MVRVEELIDPDAGDDSLSFGVVDDVVAAAAAAAAAAIAVALVEPVTDELSVESAIDTGRRICGVAMVLLRKV